MIPGPRPETIGTMPKPHSITYLGRDGFPLHAAADRLIARYRTPDPATTDRPAPAGAPAGASPTTPAADMRNLIIVTPGRRAGRRLTELLVARCERDDLIFVPPACTTPGGLDAFLVPPSPREPAGDITRQFTWAAALKHLPPDTRSHLVPADADKWELERWLEVAGEIDATWGELAGELRDFAAAGKAAGGDDPRWAALQSARIAYEALLGERGLCDARTLRMAAVTEQRCRLREDDIILVGVTDMAGSVRAMLEQVAGRVAVWVAAGADEADGYDAWGCVIPAHWAAAEIAVPDECIVPVAGPARQADAVLEILADRGGDYAAADIAIGVPDAGLLPHLHARLAACGIAAHPSTGPLITAAAPGKLLAGVAEYLETRGFRAFATLARHADVAAVLPGGGGVSLPERLDRYYAAHLPERVPAPDAWLPEDEDDPHPDRALDEKGLAALAAAAAACHELLGELAETGTRPPAEWCAPICGLLRAVYGGLDEAPADAAGRRAAEACRAAVDCLAEIGRAGVAVPPVTAAEAVRICLRRLAGRRGTPPYAAGAVELVGWLELQLDDAPVAIVTTFNDEHIPQSVRGHAFLPDTLRRRLGLVCNARRYARDAAALTGLIAARGPAAVRLVTAETAPDGGALTPSRLLLTARDGQQTARRVVALARRAREAPAIVVAGARQPAAASGFRLPAPVGTYDRGYLTATQFRAYIRSPYLFYLRYVHRPRIETVDDAAAELDAAAFGTLAHRVLERFGGEPAVKDATDAEAIAAYCHAQLDELAAATFGDNARPAVAVQLRQLRRRLTWFAAAQAGRAQEGWRIVCTERLFGAGDPVYLAADTGRLMPVRGTIDRIDYHEKEDAWAILDYKTGDRKPDPEKAHRKGGEWIDLQLPVYRRLAAPVTGGGAAALGYGCLCAAGENVGFATADWDEDELAAAEERAVGVMRDILAGRFAEIGEVPRWESDIVRDLLAAAPAEGADA